MSQMLKRCKKMSWQSQVLATVANECELHTLASKHYAQNWNTIGVNSRLYGDEIYVSITAVLFTTVQNVHYRLICQYHHQIHFFVAFVNKFVFNLYNAELNIALTV